MFTQISWLLPSPHLKQTHHPLCLGGGAVTHSRQNKVTQSIHDNALIKNQTLFGLLRNIGILFATYDWLIVNLTNDRFRDLLTICNPNPKHSTYKCDLLTFSQMLQIGRHFTVQMDNDPKHTAKATKAKKWNALQWPSQSPDLNQTEHTFPSLKTKLKGNSKQQAGTEGSCSRGLVEHHQGWNLPSGWFKGLHTSGFMDCKELATKY